MRISLLVLLTGCLPATVHGLRTDGVLPEPGEIAVQATGGFGAPLGEGDAVGGGALGVVVPFAPGFAVAPTVGFGANVWGFDVEGRYNLLHHEDGLVVTALFGAGAVGRNDWTAGLHAGAAMSTPLTDVVRLYGGARLNPVFASEVDDVPWFHLSLGSSVRPTDPKIRSLAFLGEVTWEVPLSEPDASGIGLLLSFSYTAPLPGAR
jgi:hypothetical protein